MTKKTADGIWIGKWLHCGCCGIGFEVWPEYEDQDAGYGICRSCQGEIAEHDKAEMDKAIATLRGGMNTENQAKYDAMDRETQELFVMKALDDGILQFRLERR